MKTKFNYPRFSANYFFIILLFSLLISCNKSDVDNEKKTLVTKATVGNSTNLTALANFEQKRKTDTIKIGKKVDIQLNNNLTSKSVGTMNLLSSCSDKSSLISLNYDELVTSFCDESSKVILTYKWIVDVPIDYIDIDLTNANSKGSFKFPAQSWASGKSTSLFNESAHLYTTTIGSETVNMKKYILKYSVAVTADASYPIRDTTFCGNSQYNTKIDIATNCAAFPSISIGGTPGYIQESFAPAEHHQLYYQFQATDISTTTQKKFSFVGNFFGLPLCLGRDCNLPSLGLTPTIQFRYRKVGTPFWYTFNRNSADYTSSTIIDVTSKGGAGVYELENRWVLTSSPTTWNAWSKEGLYFNQTITIN